MEESGIVTFWKMKRFKLFSNSRFIPAGVVFAYIVLDLFLVSREEIGYSNFFLSTGPCEIIKPKYLSYVFCLDLTLSQSLFLLLLNKICQ